MLFKAKIYVEHSGKELFHCYGITAPNIDMATQIMFNFIESDKFRFEPKEVVKHVIKSELSLRGFDRCILETCAIYHNRRKLNENTRNDINELFPNIFRIG